MTDKHWTFSLKEGDEVAYIEKQSKNLPEIVEIKKVDSIRINDDDKTEVIINRQPYIKGQNQFWKHIKIKKPNATWRKKAKDEIKKKILSYDKEGIGHVIEYETLLKMTLSELRIIAPIIRKAKARRLAKRDDLK